jgi:GDP-4-dehydro-6-deoxy-D-mannose reductase
MKAVVTGITGLAGGYLAEHLLAAGDEVLGFCRSGQWPEHIPSEVRARVALHAWDAGQPHAWEAIQSRLAEFQPDCIYHLAAISIPRDCGDTEPTPQALAVNAVGAIQVAEAGASLRRPPRLLFTSTRHVYGPVTFDSPPVSEDVPLAPANGYGQSKLIAERGLREFSRENGLDVIVVRAFQHTGPRQDARMMLPGWACQFSHDGPEPIEVHNLDTHIDLTDVRDVVRAYRLLALRGAAGAYNVGSGIRRRTGDVFEILRRQADPLRAFVERYPGAHATPIADIQRLVAQTGWRPEIPLEQTVADTLAYWRGLRASAAPPPVRSAGR